MCDFNVSNVVKLEHIEILPDICQNETEGLFIVIVIVDIAGSHLSGFRFEQWLRQ